MSLAVNNQHMNSTETQSYNYFKSSNDMNKKINKHLVESYFKSRSPKETADGLKVIVDDFETEWKFAYYTSSVSERSSDDMKKFKITRGDISNLSNMEYAFLKEACEVPQIKEIYFVFEEDICNIWINVVDENLETEDYIYNIFLKFDDETFDIMIFRDYEIKNKDAMNYSISLERIEQ